MMSTEIVILLISSVLVVVGAYLWQRGNSLITTGKKSEGIIYKNNFYPSKDGGIYYPVVRFLTDKEEWTTQELKIGFLPAKEVGTKLQVIYDPEDPTIVEINSTFQLEILPRLFVALGTVSLIFGVLEFLDVTHLIS